MWQMMACSRPENTGKMLLTANGTLLHGEVLCILCSFVFRGSTTNGPELYAKA